MRKSNNWKKMHGVPMQRKSIAERSTNSKKLRKRLRKPFGRFVNKVKNFMKKHRTDIIKGFIEYNRRRQMILLEKMYGIPDEKILEKTVEVLEDTTE